MNLKQTSLWNIGTVVDDDDDVPRRAFQLPVAHEFEPKAFTRCFWLPLYGPCVISEHVEKRLLATTPALAYSYRRVCGFFSPDRTSRRLDQRLNVPVHRRCGERSSPKAQPSTRSGIEPGTFWLAVRDLTNC